MLSQSRSDFRITNATQSSSTRTSSPPPGVLVGGVTGARETRGTSAPSSEALDPFSYTEPRTMAFAGPSTFSAYLRR